MIVGREGSTLNNVLHLIIEHSTARQDPQIENKGGGLEMMLSGDVYTRRVTKLGFVQTSNH